MCVCYNNKSKYQMKNLICNWQVILFHILFYCYLHHLVNSLPHIHVCFCRVMTLHMSPMDDTFVSGSLDRTLRLWDLRSPNCQVLKMALTFLQKKSQKWLLIITWKQENLYIIFLCLFIEGLMHVNGRPVAAFDPEGLIFAAGVDSEMVKLYDLRSFDKVFLANIL